MGSPLTIPLREFLFSDLRVTFPEVRETRVDFSLPARHLPRRTLTGAEADAGEWKRDCMNRRFRTEERSVTTEVLFSSMELQTAVRAEISNLKEYQSRVDAITGDIRTLVRTLQSYAVAVPFQFHCYTVEADEPGGEDAHYYLEWRLDPRNLEQYTLFVTTFFHAEEVEARKLEEARLSVRLRMAPYIAPFFKAFMVMVSNLTAFASPEEFMDVLAGRKPIEHIGPS